MAEEALDEFQEDPVEDLRDESREKAEKRGWTDRETFEADPKNEGKTWVDYDEFLRRGELFDTIGKQRKQIDDLESRVGEFGEFLQKQTTEAFERGKKDAQARLDKAVAEGDQEAARQASDDLTSIERQAAAVPQRDYEKEFAEKNPWYGTNEAATREAIAMDAELVARFPNPEQRLEEVARRVRRLHDLDKPPENPMRDKPSAVETGRRRGASTRYTERDMSESERANWKSFNRLAGKGNEMTAHEWVESRKEMFGD